MKKRHRKQLLQQKPKPITTDQNRVDVINRKSYKQSSQIHTIMAEKREDVSKKVLFIILIVIIFISIIGTWTILDNIDKLKRASIQPKVVYIKEADQSKGSSGTAISVNIKENPHLERIKRGNAG